MSTPLPSISDEYILNEGCRHMISVVIPVYNVEVYLQRCVDSVLNQTCKDFEIILVDDGSTDSSGAMCDQYAASDYRIRTRHNTNGGPSDARNYGIEMATGEYIMFMDSDDALEPDAIEKLSASSSPDIDIVVGGYKKIYEDKTEEYTCTGLIPGRIYTAMEYLKMARLEVIVCGNLYRREYLLENNILFQTGIFYEDVEIFSRLYIHAKGITTTGGIHYIYYIRQNSRQTSIMTQARSESLIRIFNGWMRDFSKIADQEARERLYSYLIDYFLWSARDCHWKGWTVAGMNLKFCLKYAHRGRSKVKAIVYQISPELMWKIKI